MIYFFLKKCSIFVMPSKKKFWVKKPKLHGKICVSQSKKCQSYNFHIWKLCDWHFFDGDTKFFPNSFGLLPRKLFCSFSTPNRALYANNHFPKKKFACKIYFLYNVVLDTIIMAFFSFLLLFLSKTLKIPIFFCLACLCLIIWITKK